MSVPSFQTKLLIPFPQVQGDYYGDLAARFGYFPSSIVLENQTLKPGKIDVKTDVSVLGVAGFWREDPWVLMMGKNAPILGCPAALLISQGQILSLP
jgi:hypothetical protein